VYRAFTPDELRAFFEALGHSFEHPAELVVVGGAGAVLRHGATRPTVDIDIYSVPPPEAFAEAVTRAREKTSLVVPIEYPAVAQAPWNYQDRLEPVTGLALGDLTVLVPERHDLALMKLMRSDERDLQVIAQMHQANPLDLDTLITRFTDEMTHVVADHAILRLKLLVCIERLFGSPEVEAARERIERTPLAREFAAAAFVRERSFLATLGIRPETVHGARFDAVVRQEIGGEIVFPYRDGGGIVALERRAANRTGVSGRPQLGIWSSAMEQHDRTLVLVTDPLEALAHAQANPDPRTRYLATGSSLTGERRRLISTALAEMPADARVVLALPAAQVGHRLAAEIHRLAPRKTEIHHPPFGRSWTDFVQKQQQDWILAQGFTIDGKDRGL
jgi:hypothetical protein